MKLVAIDCRRLPGIDTSLRVGGLAPGLNLIVGQNGIGKSSLGRAIGATLWPAQAAETVEVEAEWEHDGRRLRATCRERRTVWEGAVPPLPAAHLARGYILGVRDLLDPGASADRAIGEAIRVEMAGGYDLAALRRAATLAPRHGQREGRELQAAEQARAKIVAAHATLADEAAKLPEIEVARARALAAQRRLDHLAAACELAGAREALAAARARLAALPAPLAQLSGQEPDQLARLARAAAEARAEVAAVEVELARATAAAAATELPGPPVDEVSGSVALASARAVKELEGEVRQAEAARAAAAAELAAIGGTGEVGAAEMEQIEGLVERLQDHQRRAAELATRLALVLPVEGGEEPARLNQGESALQRWLVVAEGPPPPPVWLVALAGVAIVAGTLLAAHPYAALLLGASAGVLAYAAASQYSARRNRQAREVAQDLYAESRLAPPAGWTREGVKARLDELRNALARAAQQRVAADERRRLQPEQERLAALAGELAEVERGWRTRLGMAPGSSLQLLDLGHRLDLRRRVSIELVAAETRLATGRAALAKQGAAVAHLLAPHGLAPDPTLAVAGGALVAAAEGVVSRSRDHRQAVREIAELQQRRARAGARQAAAEGEAGALFARAGVAGERELVALLERLPDYRTAASEVARLEVTRAELEARLAGEVALLTLSREAAEAQLADSRAQAARLDELARQAGDIEGRIRQATAGDALETSRAAVAEARAALAARRAEALEAAVADLLLQRVEEEYREVARPPVLQRASGWFATFTHHRYTLRVAEGGELVAEESESGAVRALEELSDGTRAQLLLAARIAFATHHEAGVALPLILDEALSLADPERFDAVAEALLELVAEGRQLFYLTANPGDCLRWSQRCAARGKAPPHTIDLAALRTGQRALDVATLTVAPAATLPFPDGLSAAAYGAALGVGRPDPARPATLHLFHLLRGDLGLLYHLLSTAHVATVGQWRTLSRAGGGVAVAGGQAAHLDALCQLAEATFAAWQVGRGRPLERAGLAASGVVSGHYLEPLADIAAEVGGDARALVARLERRGGDPRTRGFRADKRAELIEYLRREGYLDARAPLDGETLRARVLADLTPAITAGALAVAEVDQRVRELITLLESAPQ